MGEKTPLTITRVTVQPGGTVEVDKRPSAVFTALLNPTDCKHTQRIEYSKPPVPGQIGPQVKFARMAEQHVTFALVLDGTGVVATARAADSLKEVSTLIAELNRVIYTYDGELHQPNHVQVLWGSLLVVGRLASMTTNYTLFKPSGEPLRAKVDLDFVRFTTGKQASLIAARSSPDLSHVLMVRAGDTLPLMCHRVYGDASYYPEVARHNRLTDFRRLEPGRELHFPPLG